MHECVIGLLHGSSSSELVTIVELEEHIFDTAAFNAMLPKRCSWMRRPEWSLADYADRRKSTNLARFHNCPECGQKIDWKSIRRYGDG